LKCQTLEKQSRSNGEEREDLLGNCFAVNVSYMISTIQKTLSGAFSSLTSTKEPKLLKRPPTHISSQPDDPATSPQTAPMPQKRQSTPSIRNTKRQKGGKAAQFLSKRLKEGEEEDDPIEVRAFNI
jgi:hypothetical protein